MACKERNLRITLLLILINLFVFIAQVTSEIGNFLLMPISIPLYFIYKAAYAGFSLDPPFLRRVAKLPGEVVSLYVEIISLAEKAHRHVLSRTPNGSAIRLAGDANVQLPVLFNTLTLSDHEFKRLKAEQALLTPEEIMQLSILPRIKEELSRYIEQRKALEEDTCCLTLERPLPESTMILVKQYQKEGAWHAVPLPDAKSLIIDREALQRDSSENPIHPISRDPLNAPSRYHDFPTRYRIHPCYGSKEKTFIVSQELNYYATCLRTYLPQGQDPVVVTGPSAGLMHRFFANFAKPGPAVIPASAAVPTPF